MKQIYVMRHSEPLKCNNIENGDSLQVQNEKWTLTENGENIAKEKSKLEELQNFDIVFSSNCDVANSTNSYAASYTSLGKLSFSGYSIKYVFIDSIKSLK